MMAQRLAAALALAVFVFVSPVGAHVDAKLPQLRGVGGDRVLEEESSGSTSGTNPPLVEKKEKNKILPKHNSSWDDYLLSTCCATNSCNGGTGDGFAGAA